MYLELKKAIINWLVDHENEWQRLNACTAHFRRYIFDEDGNYIIGGEIVCDFIKRADELLFGEK